VIGLTLAQATTALHTATLVVGTTTNQISSAPVGTVVSSSPVAGSTVEINTAVNLVLSSGPSSVLVPDVRGQTVSAAGTMLTGVGLVTGTVSQEHSNTVAAGLVIRSNPAGGSSVATGSSVDLVLSSGPIGSAEVQIISPGNGVVFTQGQIITVTYKVKGVAGDGPYSAKGQDNGDNGQTASIPLGDIGTNWLTVLAPIQMQAKSVVSGAFFTVGLFNGAGIEVARAQFSYSVLAPSK
jgi:beta-lactam-binding protein with PASTA domain